VKQYNYIFLEQPGIRQYCISMTFTLLLASLLFNGFFPRIVTKLVEENENETCYLLKSNFIA